jgi:hypothetical protein
MGSICRGGQPCSVSWEDNGESPLLQEIGITRVALYTGKQVHAVNSRLDTDH